MNHKAKVIIEIIIVIGLFVWYTITTLIPELKQEYGSSDTFMNSNYYNNMIELNIDNKVDFAIITNKENKLYHLLFFSKEATTLHNENIENNTLEIGINKIIQLLIDNKQLNKTSSINIIRYNDNNYEEVKNSLISALSIYDIEPNITEEEKTLKDKLEELSLSGEEQDNILLELDYYSKSFTGIGNKKNKN